LANNRSCQLQIEETTVPSEQPPTTGAGFAAASSDPSAARAYSRRIWAWSWYDWADHAYITTTAATFFPPYFIAIAAPAFLAAGKVASDSTAVAVARDTASNLYALTVSIALFVAALLAPLLGAYADITGRRKRLLIVFTIIGAVLASLMFVLTTGLWFLGLVLYFATQVALNIALGFNSSLLPHIARQDDMNRVSSLGYAMGYIGGGALLALNTALYLFAGQLGIDSSLAVRIAFLSVGLWWLGFSVPLIRGVPEPPATPLAHDSRGNPMVDAFVRLGHTLRDIRRYRELFRMLIAFWLYSEGIGAIILLATAYGAALGLNTAILIATLLMTQLVAFPYALLYGRIPDPANRWRSAFVSMLVWTGVTLPMIGIYANLNGELDLPHTFALIGGDQVLGILFSFLLGRHLLAGFAKWLDTKRTVLLGLAIYTVIPIWGFFLHSQAEFFMIGWLVGTVQGGTQALSRSIYADLSPRRKSGEFFGLYGLSEKFAGILGPLLYAIVGQLTHDPRSSILSISVFFLAGMYLLWKVNEREGAAVAAAENAQIEVISAAD
jgi:UMF1 family MFS transporter